MERITDMTPIIRIETEKIIIGNNLFAGFGSNSGGELKVWDADLSLLEEGEHMFEHCDKLETFKGNLNSLIKGNYMFNGCSALTSFSSELGQLTNGAYMFNGCSALTSFSSDLSKITNGAYMFSLSGEKHIDLNFTSSLDKLTDGTEMFKNRKLSLSALGNIAGSIPITNGTGAKIHIGSWTSQDFRFAQANISIIQSMKKWQVDYDIID